VLSRCTPFDTGFNAIQTFTGAGTKVARVLAGASCLRNLAHDWHTGFAQKASNTGVFD
jgi:hypothetical protein